MVLTECVPLQEVEHGGQVEEGDIVRLIPQLEGGVSTEVKISLCFSEQSKTKSTETMTCMFPQPVTVVKNIADQTIPENQCATFECQIRINYPEISLTWYKGTQKLDASEKYDIGRVGDNHYLKIRNCRATDQGNYRVVCGPHISNAKLTVTGKSSSCEGGSLSAVYP